MSNLYNFKKNNLLRKADKKNNNQRDIKIINIKKVHSILIVLEKDANIEPSKKLIKKIFPNSKITCLSFRPQKEDLSSHYNFHFHPSDLGFGKIKNERLIGLLNSNFDISIDFVTKNNDLNYFVKMCNASLKIGNLHSSKNYLYDLLVEKGKSNATFLENIETQLKTLGSHEH